jgi:hypothetical protein
MGEDSEGVVSIFAEALQCPQAERGAYLNRVCAGDDELRRKLEALLSAHERLGDFMERPPDF